MTAPVRAETMRAGKKDWLTDRGCGPWTMLFELPYTETHCLDLKGGNPTKKGYEGIGT